MNLSSFVNEDSYESLYELIRYLLSFYDGTAKETTSIIIVSGITSSGKTTLTKIICNLVNWRKNGNREIVLYPSMNRISADDLREYGSGKYITGKHISGSQLYLFEQDLVTCGQLKLEHNIGVVAKFHEAINTSITHRRIYHDISTITNPAVLLLEFNEDEVSAHPFLMSNGIDASCFHEVSRDNSRRAIKIISLPDKDLLSTSCWPRLDSYYSNFVTQCLQELDDIITIRDIYKHYNKFRIFRQFHLFTEIMSGCATDISIHVFSLLLKRSVTNITGEWLKILLPLFNE
jgi:hypothetical protein